MDNPRRISSCDSHALHVQHLEVAQARTDSSVTGMSIGDAGVFSAG